MEVINNLFCASQSHVHGDERCAEDERQHCYERHAGKIPWRFQDQEGVSRSYNEEVTRFYLNTRLNRGNCTVFVHIYVYLCQSVNC